MRGGSYLRVGFLNVNSLRCRIEKLRLYLNDNPSYHIFVIAESWLGPIVDDSVIQIKGYTILRQDRNIHGGGVILYIRKDFSVVKLGSSNTEVDDKPGIPEYLLCSVQQGNSPPILVGLIYRPPKVAMQKKSKKTQNQSDLFDQLRKLSSDYGPKFIMGDFNADLSLDPPEADAITVRNLVKELSLQIIEHGPTHHKTATTHTRIDLILTDVNDVIIDHWNEHLPSFGQHAIVDVTTDFFIPTLPKESFSFRNFKDMCPTSLNELLSQCNWESMTSIETDLEGTLNNLNANLNDTIDQLAPVFTINNKYAP